MAELVLFPHCDIHVALNHAPAVRITVCERAPASPTPTHLVLTDVTASCAYDFFAPHNAVGSRLKAFANIDATGLITPTAVGTNLVQIRHGNDYVIARIQVHADVLGWWLGNASITTAVDTQFAHAQPSIHALFSDDAATRTDLIGDVTGHGFVPLTSSDTSKVTVEAHGRLRGVAEGTATVSGTFLGKTQSLPVKVLDYAKTRDVLDGVQLPNLAGAAEMHNILFVGEGFRTADRETFDKVVTDTFKEMFSKPRHQPYSMLEGAFNIWKAYEPSAQHGVTVASRIQEQDAADGVLPKGVPIPLGTPLSNAPPANYTVELLIRRVGLARRNETRTTAQLTGEWAGQTLQDFDAAKVDDNLIKAWKASTFGGILEARDTIFGLQLGGRPGDRRSGTGLVPLPGNETAGDAVLRRFIGRVYEWFEFEAPRTLTPDPRRHPPELNSLGSPHNNAILRYFKSLRGRFPQHPNVGGEWVSDVVAVPTRFQPSVGLVALIVNDHMLGGTNFRFATANTLAPDSLTEFDATTAGTERPLRRKLPDSISPVIENIINTVAHEFGHSLNLADEYEDFPGDDPGLNESPNIDFGFDNVTRLGKIHRNGVVVDGKMQFPNREIDAAKIKWAALPRPELSALLLADSTAAGGGIRVTIDPRTIAHWVAAKAQNREVSLRQRDVDPGGRQLPLQTGPTHVLDHLTIQSIDEAAGAFVLGGASVPATPAVFRKGSHVHVQRRNAAGDPLVIVEKKVLAKLNASHTWLNQDTDTTQVNRNEDSPVDVPDFKAPCKSYKLVGVYEGASTFAGGTFRPAGLCKMRKSSDTGTGDGEFCHVCKYLLVNRLDPGLHDLLDRLYYPKAKKGGGDV